MPFGIDAQIAGARVGLASVRSLHGDEAVALDRNIQILAGRSCAPLVVSQPVVALVA